jgi:uncharacterized protein YndB with AHSA1/START domain
VPTFDALQLRLTRELDASPPTVWRALTEADALARWWGPAGFTIPAVDLDLRVGGRYRIEMKPPEGDPFFLEGEFHEVAPPSRLAYTFRWEPPDPDDRENVVTLSLTERAGKTELTLVHGPFATEARLELHRGGWTDSIDKLGSMISLGGGGPYHEKADVR